MLGRLSGGHSFLSESLAKSIFERRFVNGVNKFGIPENGLIPAYRTGIERNKTGHPAMAMDDIGNPAQLHNNFNNTFIEENNPFIIIGIEPAFVIMEHTAVLKEILIIKKIDLHFRHR